MRHVYQDQTIGGADILNSLADVNINNPEDGQMMVYDASTQTWRNVTQKSLNDLAEVTDLTDIIATGTTNATGGTITKGKFFYLNDDLCQAKADIASGATFTLNTNYEEVTAGGLNALNSNISDCGKLEFIKDIPASPASTTWTPDPKYKGYVARLNLSGYVFELSTRILEANADYDLLATAYYNSTTYCYIPVTIRPTGTSYTFTGSNMSVYSAKLYGIL